MGWGNTVWRSPSGREIHDERVDDLHEAEFTLADGTKRYLHWAGSRVIAIAVDGERWVPAPVMDFDVIED